MTNYDPEDIVLYEDQLINIKASIARKNAKRPKRLACEAPKMLQKSSKPRKSSKPKK